VGTDAARPQRGGRAKAGTTRRPLERQVEQLEQDLSAWQEEQHELDRQLADPAFYASPDSDRLKGIALRRDELARLIEEAEHRWLEVQEALNAVRDR
jgi:ATP-binding cassette, subfamily F, member 3